MRRIVTILIAAGLAAGIAAPLAAQSARNEGPLAPCRPEAMAFDQRLSRMVGPGADSASFEAATRMRNEGMAACRAGNAAEGRRMIEQATAALSG